MVQMRIDTDLITYLSHVILPEQIVNMQIKKQQQFLPLHMDNEELDDSKQIGENNHDSSDIDQQILNYQAQSDIEEVYTDDLNNASP